MTEKRIREILASVASGKVGTDAAFEALKDLPFEDLGFAKLDSHRTMRRGVPEVVFGENKTVDQIAAIGARVVRTGTNLIITRLAADKARALKRKILRPTSTRNWHRNRDHRTDQTHRAWNDHDHQRGDFRHPGR